MANLPEDLNTLLAQAKSRVESAQKIWVVASLTYDTTIQFTRAVVLGGGVSLHSPIVMCVDKIGGLPYDWVPKMEAVAKSGRGLITICHSVEQGEALATLIVNHVRKVLLNAAINSGGRTVPQKWKTSLDRAVKHNESCDIAYIRKTASAIIPNADDRALDSQLTDIAIIKVGGRDYHDFANRFKSLTNTVLELGGEPPWSFGFSRDHHA